MDFLFQVRRKDSQQLLSHPFYFPFQNCLDQCLSFECPKKLKNKHLQFNINNNKSAEVFIQILLNLLSSLGISILICDINILLSLNSKHFKISIEISYLTQRLFSIVLSNLLEVGISFYLFLTDFQLNSVMLNEHTLNDQILLKLRPALWPTIK